VPTKPPLPRPDRSSRQQAGATWKGGLTCGVGWCGRGEGTGAGQASNHRIIQVNNNGGPTANNRDRAELLVRMSGSIGADRKHQNKSKTHATIDRSTTTTIDSFFPVFRVCLFERGFQINRSEGPRNSTDKWDGDARTKQHTDTQIHKYENGDTHNDTQTHTNNDHSDNDNRGPHLHRVSGNKQFDPRKYGKEASTQQTKR
jgi:hypothetical protein